MKKTKSKISLSDLLKCQTAGAVMYCCDYTRLDNEVFSEIPKDLKKAWSTYHNTKKKLDKLIDFYSKQEKVETIKDRINSQNNLLE